MKAIMISLLTTVALTAMAQLPADGFNPNYATQHWYKYVENETVFYNENDSHDLNSTWSYVPSSQYFVFLFSRDAYGYRVAVRKFDNLPGTMIDKSFYASYVEGYHDYNSVNLSVRSRSAEVMLIKEIAPGRKALLIYSPDAAAIIVYPKEK